MESKVKIATSFMDALQLVEIERLLSYLSDDVKIVGASGAKYGKPELTQYFGHYTPPFKDVKTSHVGTYSVNDHVIFETVINATHVNDYMGIKASYKSFEMPVINVFEVKDDKITAWRQYQNFKILADLHIG